MREQTDLHLRRLAWSVAVFWALLLACLFILRPPFWALMDDSSNLELSRMGHSMGLFSWLHWYIPYDRGWGMCRIFYGIFIYLFYNLSKSPFIAYSVLLVSILLLFLSWTCLYRSWMPPDQPSTEKSLWSLLFFIACCLFTPHYNLILFASLQEKFILLAAVIMAFSADALRRSDKTAIWSIPLLFVGYAIGLFSKATTVFLSVPIIVLLLGLAPEKRSKRVWLTVLLMGAASAAFAYFSMHSRDSYSNAYQVSNLPERLLTIGPRFQLPFLFAIASLAATVWQGYRQAEPRASDFWPRTLFWPLGLLGFLTIMLPWPAGVSGYLLAPAGLFLVGSFLNFSRSISLPRWNPTHIAGALLVLELALAPLAIVKLWTQIAQHHGAALVVAFIQNKMNKTGTVTRFILPEPCAETSVALGIFSGHPTAVALAKGHQFPSFGGAPIGQPYLIINADCSSKVIQGFEPGSTVFHYPPWFIFEGQVKS